MLRCNIQSISSHCPSFSPSQRSLWSLWPFPIILKATQTFVCRHKWRQIHWWMKRVKTREVIDTFLRYANDLVTLWISRAYQTPALSIMRLIGWLQRELLSHSLRCKTGTLWRIFKSCDIQHCPSLRKHFVFAFALFFQSVVKIQCQTSLTKTHLI